MKRTTLKRKPWSKEKKVAVRKKKQSISLLKKKLWHVFSEYIKARDKNKCFTCDKVVFGMNCHAGHFIPKSVGGVELYFHEKNVHVQCARCNIWLSGNQWEYGKRLGEKTVSELMEIKKKISKWSEGDYIEKIDIYEWKLSKLSPTK